MSKSDFVDGICLSSDHNGLLSVDEERLIKIIKKQPIADTYHVEHTPFASENHRGVDVEDLSDVDEVDNVFVSKHLAKCDTESCTGYMHSVLCTNPAQHERMTSFLCNDNCEVYQRRKRKLELRMTAPKVPVPIEEMDPERRDVDIVEYPIAERHTQPMEEDAAPLPDITTTPDDKATRMQEWINQTTPDCSPEIHTESCKTVKGKFAAVRKCTHKETGVEYAAKFIRKRRRAMDQRQDILHEVAVLKLAANNTRIVRLHEVYETPSEMALVLEMASGGELQHVLDAEDGIPEFHAVKFMRQIIEGLSFLHEQNIAHLDLKPQNLLLTGVYPDCDIKLCDFGISRIIQNGVEVREILGTPDYVAPEILSYEPISLATDIWSVGVLAYVLLSGYSPFGGDTKQETFCNISQCCLNFPEELFEGVSSTAKEFIQATLVKDPSNRLTSQQCLEHPWLSGSSCALTPSSKELVLSSTGASSVGQEETDGVKTSVVITDLPSHILEASRANGIKSSHSLENGISCSRKKDDGNETKTAEGNHHAHSDDSEELPVNKRPKNSPTHYPVASCLSCAQCGSQCCHIHKTPRSRHQHHHSSITNSPVEITVDRAIIC